MRLAMSLAVATTLCAHVALGQVTLSGSGKQKRTMPPMPTLGYGTPRPMTTGRTLSPVRWDARTVSAAVGGRTSNTTLLHLRGLDGIERAQGLPDGVRRLLEMHVRTLRPGEPDHYLVNVKLAEEWSRTHPVPANIKPSDNGGDSHSGCDVISTHCASEAAQHAAGQVSQEWQKLWEQAVADWKHAATQLSNEYNTLEACFADSTLPALKIPVPFNITPSMTVGLETSGSKDLGGGTASGSVQGTVGLAFPMQSDVQAKLELFYIPCLPFVVRPKSISGAGGLTVGERLTASVKAAGKFDKVFTIPPTGGPQFPIEVFPIVIDGVPIAELDLSAYIEGNIEVGGQGTAEGRFQLDNPHKANFEFTCSGAGCQARALTIPDPTTTTESAQILGQVFVRPAIFTALQLDFDFDALTARVGPQPYLLGTASGCAAATGSQTVGGGSTSTENHGLMTDVDWGIDLRAEALIARKVIDPAYRHSMTGDRHVWFRDVAPGGSTSLVVLSSGPTQVAATKTATFKVRMPSCYPYTNTVQYRVSWTGNATPAASPSCKWQSGDGTCAFDPTKDLTLGFTWSTPGTYAITIVAVRDDHPRVFSPAPKPTQLNVTVAAAGGTAP